MAHPNVTRGSDTQKHKLQIDKFAGNIQQSARFSNMILDDCPQLRYSGNSLLFQKISAFIITGCVPFVSLLNRNKRLNPSALK